MKPEIIMSRRREMTCMAVMAVVAALAAFSIHTAHRIYRNDAGICIEKGRALTEQELKQQVIKHIILMEWNNDRINPGRSYQRLGFIPTGPNFDLLAMIDKSYQSSLSFEENFQVKIISQEATSLVPFRSMLKDGYGLVIYNDYKGGTVYFIDFSSLKVANVNNSTAARPASTLYLRYMGYGRHYFELASVFFERECCDMPGERLYEYRNDDYSKIKERAYNNAKRSLKWGRQTIFAVTNCGRILARKDDQNKMYDEIQPLVVIFKGDCK